jgi:phosphinothricin acetyltransferase
MRPIIRLATASDAKAVAEIYAPVVINTATSFEVLPPSEAEMRNRILDILATHPWLVCESQGAILGYAYAGKHRVRAAYQWSVDVTVYVDQNMKRRGIGRALYTSLLAVVAEQGFYNAFAGITLPNSNSVGLHEAFGFRQIALYKHVGHKLGAWHDVGWWQLTLRKLDNSPEDPRSIQDIKDSASFEEAIERGLVTLKDM